MALRQSVNNLRAKKRRALLGGGTEKTIKQHEKGKLTARERLTRLLDEDSFIELGLLACSDVPGMEDQTPADGWITGYGRLDGRQVCTVANDFTVLGASNARINTKKAAFMRSQSEEKGIPLIWLGEAGGGRLPDIEGARGICSLAGQGGRSVFPQYTHNRRSPWITAAMGGCYGVPTWQACLSDFVVQVKGSLLLVSGPRPIRRLLQTSSSPEEMGGWKVHAEVTGISDQVAEDEENCFKLIKEFFDYMPSSCTELPPKTPDPHPTGKSMDPIFDFFPENRVQVYDMIEMVKALADQDSYLELKPFFGRAVVTCLCRIGGRTAGIIANQPLHQAGAMGTDGLDKITSFMCLCDSFNIPLVFLHDIPGFITDKNAEHSRVSAKVTNALHALSQVTVPKISIILRKSYGQAMYNMCGPGAGPDFVAAWPTAEVSFLDPDVATDIVYGKYSEEERKKFREKMVRDTGPYPLAQGYYVFDIIEPSETRNYIIKMLEIIYNSENKGMSRHLLANWPTKF
jgi:acetyl-CoA carboxylase carboxyltransferase component